MSCLADGNSAPALIVCSSREENPAGVHFLISMHNFPLSLSLSLYKINMAKEVVFGLKELLAYEGNVEEDMALTFQVLSNVISLEFSF